MYPTANYSLESINALNHDSWCQEEKSIDFNRVFNQKLQTNRSLYSLKNAVANDDGTDEKLCGNTFTRWDAKIQQGILQA